MLKSLNQMKKIITSQKMITETWKLKQDNAKLLKDKAKLERDLAAAKVSRIGLKEKDRVINLMYRCLMKEANEPGNWLLRHAHQYPKYKTFVPSEHMEQFLKAHKKIRKHVTEDVEDLKVESDKYTSLRTSRT